MKKGFLPIGLKKYAALLLHIFFLCLFLAGVTLVRFNENYGRGVDWMEEESYSATRSFTEQLEADVESIFKYVQYKDLLELDGELNMNADMFCITYISDISKIYTLGEAISYARRLGYYLNDEYEVVGGPDVHERDQVGFSLPSIEWKAYSPNEVATGPGDAFATVEELSVQVLEILGEYYQVRDYYINRPSNLYFRVSYVDDDGEEHLYTNAPEKTQQDLREMGRYLFVSGDTLFIDTNLRHTPHNITSELSTHNQYLNDDYYILLGLDTTYPNQDPYSEAHAEYQRIRNEYLTGLNLLTCGMIGFFVTLIWMMTLTGHVSGDRKKIVLHYADQLPLEVLLILFVFLLWAGRLTAERWFPSLLRLIVSDEHLDYAVMLARRTFLYLILLYEALSLLRNYKARTLWSGSIACRGLSQVLPMIRHYPLPLRLTVRFLFYLFCNGLILLVFYFMRKYRTLLPVPNTYLLPLIPLGLLQVWVYLLQVRDKAEADKIMKGIFKMSAGDTKYKIDASGFSETGAEVSQALNTLSDGLETALQEQVKSERLKADLITNVSHDIKTPLTSIINYVDLLKREKIQDEKIQGYLDVLDQKSQRLKTLTEDLVEASKASSGNLKLEIAEIDFVELIQQANGEFEERFAARHLEMVPTLPAGALLIAADGRRLWRVIENLYTNVCKYAMEGSRVYIDMFSKNGSVCFTIKNISASPLNINADELTERFVRGDVARTTEGSGLGLSIAKSLTELQGGTFELYIDGDLFKAQVSFPILTQQADA